MTVMGKHTDIRRIMAGLVIAAALALAAPISSLATVYECNTKQVMWWNNGRIVPYTSVNSRKDAILRFNDETGQLDAAFDNDSAFGSEHFEITQRMTPGNTLTAVLNSKPNDYYVSTDVFRLQRDADESALFLHFISGENRISTGRCHVFRERPAEPVKPKKKYED